jgi:hypothetical protein
MSVRGQKPAAGVPRSGSSGREPSHSVGLVDTSARSKDAEAAPTPRDVRFERLVDHSHDLIVVKEFRRAVSAGNPESEPVSGDSPEEMVGTSMVSHLPPGQAELAEPLFGQIATGVNVLSDQLFRASPGQSSPDGETEMTSTSGPPRCGRTGLY